LNEVRVFNGLVELQDGNVMMLRWIFRIVEWMWNDFLNRIIHRWIHAVQLTVQLLNAISVVCEIELTESNVFQSDGALECFTFDAMAWKRGREGSSLTECEILPAVNTYFLFSSTPPHALNVRFVASAIL
jgi:hypothetical protein